MNNNILSALNIGKIASSLNKTLGIVNKALPIYEEIKPLFKNVNSLTNILNMLNSKETNNKIQEIPKVQETKKVSNNLPTFFQ